MRAAPARAVSCAPALAGALLSPRLPPRPNSAVVSGWPQVIVPHRREEGEAEDKPSQSAVCGGGAAERTLPGQGSAAAGRDGGDAGLSRGSVPGWAAVAEAHGLPWACLPGQGGSTGNLCRVLCFMCLIGLMENTHMHCFCPVGPSDLKPFLHHCRRQLSSLEVLIHPW